jgi:hypothetical protein
MPSLPQPLVKRVALLFGLAGLCLGAALALAAGRIASRSGDVLAAMDRTSADVTGSIGGATGARLPLTDEQRGHIFDGIMKLRDAPVADVPAPDAIAALPNSVPLQELPASVTREIPMVLGYKFVKLDDRILLVRPRDRSVVAEMPRYHTVLD